MAGGASRRTLLAWHARYNADGDYLSVIFPDDAATMTIADLASISYYTNRPTGTAAGRDWWIQIYTRPTGTSGWYDDKFINNYNGHTSTNEWTQYSTDSGAMTFNSQTSSTGEMTLTELIGYAGGQEIEMISVQTDSGWNGFDGYLDGLEITLTNGNVGRVNFEAVPEPSILVGLISMGLMGLCIAWRRRKRA